MERNTIRPLVSVIMNCYNSERFLKEAIESVYAQDMGDWEIVFFDNHSTDRSAQIARSFDGKLRYFKNEGETVSLGKARRLAIQEAQGKYIAILDCDDLWLSQKLSKQISRFERSGTDRAIGLCYSDAMRISAEGKDLVPYSYERKLYSGDVYVRLMRDCFVDMSSALFLKGVFDAVGGFDEKYFLVEDWDLWLKIALDYDFLLVNEILVKVRIHNENGSKNLQRHNDEKTDLIKQLPIRNSMERETQEKTLQELRLRKKIEGFFVDNEPTVRFRNAVELFLCSVQNPLCAVSILRRFLNPKMISLYLRKFG